MVIAEFKWCPYQLKQIEVTVNNKCTALSGRKINLKVNCKVIEECCTHRKGSVLKKSLTYIGKLFYSYDGWSESSLREMNVRRRGVPGLVQLA